MKLPFLSNKKRDFQSSNGSWPWPTYCQHPKTLSFRAENMLKTLNSSYLEHALEVVDSNSNLFTTSSSNSDQSASFSTSSDESSECVETVIKGLRSERLFFKPEQTSSILEEANNNNIRKQKAVADEQEQEEEDNLLKESVVLSMDSNDPYVDFKKSMQEMVEAHGLKDWQSLEELLCCYLKVNGKSNHGYIISAFADLLVALTSSSSSSSCSSSSSAKIYCRSSYCSCSHSPSSPLSFYTSSNFSDDSSSTPFVSSLQVEDEDEDEEISIIACLSSSLEAKKLE